MGIMTAQWQHTEVQLPFYMCGRLDSRMQHKFCGAVARRVRAWVWCWEA
jgi:hypothetical protein